VAIFYVVSKPKGKQIAGSDTGQPRTILVLSIYHKACNQILVHLLYWKLENNKQLWEKCSLLQIHKNGMLKWKAS